MNIKQSVPENAWKCTQCGQYFIIYGPAMSKYSPKFCPQCGIKNEESKKEK